MMTSKIHVFDSFFVFKFFQPEKSFSEVSAASVIASQTRETAAAAILAANTFDVVADVHLEGGREALATPISPPPFPPLWEDDDDDDDKEEIVFDRGKYHGLTIERWLR